MRCFTWNESDLIKGLNSTYMFIEILYLIIADFQIACQYSCLLASCQQGRLMGEVSAPQH